MANNEMWIEKKTEPTEDEPVDDTSPDVGMEAEAPLENYRRTYYRLIAQGKAQEAVALLAQHEQPVQYIADFDATGTVVEADRSE